MRALLGIDLGTTHLKALLFEPEGGRVAGAARAATPVSSPRPGWAECHPQVLWERVAACVREAVAAAPGPVEVGAVAVSSMGESGLALDARGEPLTPILLYHDRRGAEFVQFWEREVGPEPIHQITGQVLRPIFAAHKLLWLRAHEAALWPRVARWLSTADYVTYRLCGRAVTDLTLASRTMLFDQRHRVWSDEITGRVGLRGAQLPEIVPSGTGVGRLTAPAAAVLGLPEGVMVVAGGHDHLCAALACGATAPGDWVDSMGTAAALLVLAPEFRGGGEVYRAGFSCYPHVAPGVYVIQGGLSAAGSGLAWLAGLTGASVEELLDEAAGTPPGAGGVVWLPFFRGSGTPHRDEQARGSITGLAPEHTRAHLARALCEGLACWARANTEALSGVAGAPLQLLRLTGGANEHPLMGQLKADVVDVETQVALGGETAALGAALLAGLGAGDFQDAGGAAAATGLAWRGHRPREIWRNRYDRLYVEAYAPLYRALRPIFKSGWDKLQED